ncbi:hypothetical protein BJX64DRAFT_255286 [Aspergillus heterothallicus]
MYQRSVVRYDAVVCKCRAVTPHWRPPSLRGRALAAFHIYLSRIRFVHKGDFTRDACPLELSPYWLAAFLLLQFFPL